MFSNAISDIGASLKAVTLGDFFDILLVSFIVYSFFRLIKDTKAYQMAIGLGVVVILFIITSWGKLYVTHQIISSFINIFIIAVIILFQGEIRRFLTALGSQSFTKHFSSKSAPEEFADFYHAVDYLSCNKIGALVAFEHQVSLKSFADRGTPLDAILTKDLIVSIFFPNNPLHDGAVIVSQNKIVAAGCLLPLPATHKLGDHFQTRTRHLAALGLSQETDAAVVIVSEETGTISLAIEGNLERGLDKNQLKERLENYLS